MGPQQVTYYLKAPETRPNPFRVGATIVFIDGKWTSMIEGSKIEDADKMLAAYGASREVPDWAQTGDGDGVSDNETDGQDVGGWEASTEGDVLPNGEAPEEGDEDGPADAEGDAGDAGSGSSEESSKGAANQPVEPETVETEQDEDLA